MRRHEVDGNFARLFNDVDFKELDLKSNMKGFFENFLALSVKKLKTVLMILPSISGRGRAFPAAKPVVIESTITIFYYLVLVQL